VRSLPKSKKNQRRSRRRQRSNPSAQKRLQKDRTPLAGSPVKDGSLLRTKAGGTNYWYTVQSITWRNELSQKDWSAKQVPCACRRRGVNRCVRAIPIKMEIEMGRRKELKSVCNDLLDNFVSRNNDLNGYWALGKFQAYLRSTSEDHLRFHLVADDGSTSAFPTTLRYYRRALRRHLDVRGIPEVWVSAALISVEQKSSSGLDCILKITDDLGRIFTSQRTLNVRQHDPNLELRRCGQHGPQNQKGE